MFGCPREAVRVKVKVCSQLQVSNFQIFDFNPRKLIYVHLLDNA